METIQQPVRTRILILMIVLLALVCGTLSVAANSAPTQSAEAEATDPVSPASGSAQPTTDVPSPAPDLTSAAASEATPAAGSEATPAAAPEPAPAVAAEPAPAAAAFTALPAGDLPGWRQVFVEDFTDGDVPVGGFPGPIYGARWSENYADGTPDTAAQGQPKGQRTSGYYPSKVLGVHDGVLDMFLHSENGVAMGAAPSPRFGGASARPWNSQVYGRYSVRFKADALAGFKLAWLLWPDSKNWPQDGEIDFPEGDLSKVIYAALHYVGPNGHDNYVYRPNVPYGDWHTATTEWSPGRVEFFLDGVSIGVATSGVPDKPMHYIMQTESCSPDCPLPGTSGHVYVDWVAVWAKG